MIAWLQRLLMGRKNREELENLRRYRLLVVEYARWMGSMPDVVMVLRNLRATADSKPSILTDCPGKTIQVMDVAGLRRSVAQLRYSTLGEEPKF